MSRHGKNTVIKTVAGTVQFFYSDPERSEYADRLARYGTAARDLSEPLEAFGVVQLRSIDRTFKAQGRPQRWTALAPATIRERLRLGFGRGPILQRTKKLRKGFRSRATAKTLKIWNTQFYFPFHQFGAPRANLPARRMIVLLEQDKAAFSRIMRRHLGG